ncbi:ornithine cyclodeaminase family protein [Gulosibacter macacae]|uniref:Ornithine cyclodeaminase family protein n=1 Tax=Gulosibacter macacae TaxID=2488791 RepID=A0A3P3VXH3_9MICO|nr:ornithine cyclodeaminase family protein [Gulosibacter macacae]RRJ86748.1 ornithine cyclodeaminase family protein [Gulosibacter macacae]
MTTTIPHITEREIRQHVTYHQAMEVLREAILHDVDPANDFPREILELADHKQLLFMPSQSKRWVGSKLISVNPGNYRRNLDRIQGLYLLMDAETTTPRALIDGAELTELRTAAMSMVIADQILPRDARKVVLYGYGAQARAHLLGLKAIRPSLEQVVVTGRNQVKAEMFAANAAEHGWDARIGAAMDPQVAIPEASVVVTATGAGKPLFDGSAVRPGTLVIAIGSHNNDRRELDADLMGRSHVIVEDKATALREAGDVAIAVAEGKLDPESLTDLQDFVRGVSLPRDRPYVYKSVGMSWQDLVVAGEIYERVPTGRR